MAVGSIDDGCRIGKTDVSTKAKCIDVYKRQATRNSLTLTAVQRDNGAHFILSTDE